MNEQTQEGLGTIRTQKETTKELHERREANQECQGSENLETIDEGILMKTEHPYSETLARKKRLIPGLTINKKGEVNYNPPWKRELKPLRRPKLPRCPQNKDLKKLIAKINKSDDSERLRNFRGKRVGHSWEMITSDGHAAIIQPQTWNSDVKPITHFDELPPYYFSLTEDFFLPLKRLLLCTSSGMVVFEINSRFTFPSFQHDRAILSASIEDEIEGRECVFLCGDRDIAHPVARFAINAHFILDAFGLSPDLRFYYRATEDNLNYVTITPEDTDEWRYVIMPMDEGEKE